MRLADLFRIAATSRCPVLYLRKSPGSNACILSTPSPGDSEIFATLGTDEYLGLIAELRRELTIELEETSCELVGAAARLDAPGRRSDGLNRGLAGHVSCAGHHAVIRNMLYLDGQEHTDIYCGFRSVAEIAKHVALRNRICVELATAYGIGASELRTVQRNLDELLLRSPAVRDIREFASACGFVRA